MSRLAELVQGPIVRQMSEVLDSNAEIEQYDLIVPSCDNLSPLEK